VLDPLQHIYQCNQNRDLDQWAHCRRQSLPTTHSIHSYHNSNCQLEVVTRRSEALSAAGAVAKAELFAQKHREPKDDKEVHYKWCTDAKDGGNLPNNVRTLRAEEHDYCI